jgi:hypothetical protein
MEATEMAIRTEWCSEHFAYELFKVGLRHELHEDCLIILGIGARVVAMALLTFDTVA